MTQEKQIAVRQPMEYLPDKSITKEQAMFLLRSIWPKAPAEDVLKAAILCRQYGLNPLMRQVYLVKFDKYEGEGQNRHKTGEEWSIVLGIKATRQIAQQALRQRGIKYSYVDGPRAMSEEEQNKVFGQVDKANFRAITIFKDSQGNVFPGYGKYPKDGKPYGSDKGNDIFNMAFIRSERNGLDKMAPGELPDIEVGDDTYIEGNFKEALAKGEQQFGEKVRRDINELWGDESPKKLTEATEDTSKPSPDNAEAQKKPAEDKRGTEIPDGEGVATILANGLNLDDVKQKIDEAQWADVAKWLSMKFKLPVKKVPEMLAALSREQAEIFAKALQERTELK